MLVAVLLITGTWLFMAGATGEGLGVAEACWATWALMLGQVTQPFPDAWPLRIAFFLLPLLGLGVLVEGLVQFVLMLRDRRRNEQSWSETMAQSSSGHIVLVGLGKLGFRCYLLLRQLGEDMVVVESDPANQFLEEVRRDGTPLLVGDGRGDELLVAANLAQARSIVVATDNDLANVEIALDARRMNPSVRVVLRMFDQDMANKIREGFHIHLAMSQSALAAPRFALAAVDASIVNSFVVDDRLFVMQRWVVKAGGDLDGATVQQILEERGFAVVRLDAPGGEVLFPPASTQLAVGDRLLVQGPFESLVRLRGGRRAMPEFVVTPPTPAGA